MMTREQKVAIILGFALVLVVGVLVSDHLSGAREAKLVEIELPEQGDLPITRPFNAEPQRFAQSTEPEINERLSHLDDETPIRDAPPATAFASAPQDEQTMLESIRQGVNEAMRDLRNGNGPRPAMQTEPRNAITMGAPQRRPRQSDPGEVRTHIVRQGETLWAICEMYYGTGFVHDELRRYNSSRIRSTTGLRPGLTLLIPDRNGLGNAPPATAAKNPTIAHQNRAQAGTRTYVVKKGDTLSEISLAELGTSKRWEEILELNSDKLDEATDIAIDMKLKLPARR